jgi:general stress protein 26
MTEPVTSIDPRYGASSSSPTSWADTKDELEKAELFWLTTVRANGRPHVTPLVVAWANDALHFTTGPEEQKSKNLRANPEVILTTGRNDWQEGVDVVVEGEARLQTDQSELEDIAKAFLPKWDGDWKYSARDGKFYHPQGFEVEVYSVKPRKVFAFAKGAFGQTTHVFKET